MLKKLTKKEIKENTKKKIEFLKLVYPEHGNGEGFKEGTIEIRYLKRTEEGTKPQYSFNTWSFDEESEKYMIKSMEKVNGIPCCTYYSGYTFDRTVLKENGDTPNQINKANALYTFILPMDFDGITEQDFLEQKQRLIDLGIETVDVFTGHGFQSLILLDKKYYEKDLYKNFTALLLQKGFPVDGSIVDAARVLRLPFTYNCKQFLGTDKHYNSKNPEGIPTYIYSETSKRYALKEVMELIDSLDGSEDTIDVFEDVFAPKETPLKQEKEASEPIFKIPEDKKLNVAVRTIKDYQELYEHLDFSKLPIAIQNMLMGTPTSGIGNDSLLFLIPFLRNHIGLSLEKQIETLQIWGELCSPPWTKEEIKAEVKRLNRYDFEAQYGKYTEALEEAFGVLEFQEWKNDDEIIIPNEIFEKIKDMSDGAFRLYLAILLLVHDENRTNFTNEEICEKAMIAERTFKKHITFLKEKNVVSRKKSKHKKSGEKYEYYLNPYVGKIKGFTKIKTSLIELLFLKKVNDGQIAFYLYLKHMVGERDESVWAAQTYLAKELGKTQTAISKLTDELHAKKLIRKETKKIGRVLHSTYILLR